MEAGLAAHLPVPVAWREVDGAGHSRALKLQWRTGFIGEEENGGQGQLRGLGWVQAAPADHQGPAQAAA